MSTHGYSTEPRVPCPTNSSAGLGLRGPVKDQRFGTSGDFWGPVVPRGAESETPSHAKVLSHQRHVLRFPFVWISKSDDNDNTNNAKCRASIKQNQHNPPCSLAYTCSNNLTPCSSHHVSQQKLVTSSPGRYLTCDFSP